MMTMTTKTERLNSKGIGLGGKRSKEISMSVKPTSIIGVFLLLSKTMITYYNLVWIVVLWGFTTAAAKRTTVVGQSMTRNQHSYRGAKDCPCLDSKELPVPIRCRKVHDVENRDGDGDRNGMGTNTTKKEEVGGSGTIACYPKDFGLKYCQPHNLELDAVCVNPPPANENTTNVERPQYCYDSWCYVDYKKCLLSKHPMYQSTFVGMSDYYWSYSTCDSQNSSSSSYDNNNNINWEDSRREDFIATLHRNSRITIAIPEIWYPRHYKYKKCHNSSSSHGNEIADYDGEEYYDDTIPWHGWMIDYLLHLEQRIKNNHDNVDRTATFLYQTQQGSFSGFYFTHRSKGADRLANGNAWNAALEDVAGGIHDMAGSGFWMTTDRVQMASFSTPLAVDKNYLWVPSPIQSTATNSNSSSSSSNTTYSNFAKILQPFTMHLWLCLVGSVIATAILSIVCSNEYESHRKWWTHFRDDEWSHSSFLGQFGIAMKVLLDAILAHSCFFFGHTVDYDLYSNYPKKVLTFGYAFLVLIAVAAYTANLAAYLTTTTTTRAKSQVVGKYISDMNHAIQQEVIICAPRSLQHELLSSWPTANFLFPEDASGGSLLSMLEFYEQGNCSAIVAGTTLDQYLKDWCTHDLFNTGSIAIEVPWGIPTSSTILGGISHYILQAKKDGIQLSNHFVTTDITDPELCSSLEEDSSTTVTNDANLEGEELGQLTPQHFILPFTVLIVSAILAIIVHCCNWYSHHQMVVVEDKETAKTDDHKNAVEFIQEDSTRLESGKSQEIVAGTEAEAHRHGNNEVGFAITNLAGQILSGQRPSTVVAPPTPSTQPVEEVSKSNWPTFLRTSTRTMRSRTSDSTGGQPRGRHSSLAATTTSGTGRPSLSVFELTTLLQDSESANDPNIKMAAMEYLSKYQNQIWESLREKNKEE